MQFEMRDRKIAGRFRSHEEFQRIFIKIFCYHLVFVHQCWTREILIFYDSLILQNFLKIFRIFKIRKFLDLLGFLRFSGIFPNCHDIRNLDLQDFYDYSIFFRFLRFLGFFDFSDFLDI